MECLTWPPARSLAQSVPSLAYGDLLRSKNAADTLYRVLGFRLERAREPVALSQVDGRNGTIRTPEGEGRFEGLVSNPSQVQLPPVPLNPEQLKIPRCAPDKTILRLPVGWQGH